MSAKNIQASFPKKFEMSQKELEVVKMISSFPGVIQFAAKDLSPALLSNYLFNLVKSYNSFYQDSPIIREENSDLKNFRLQLSIMTSKVLERGMNILGIEMPERM